MEGNVELWINVSPLKNNFLKDLTTVMKILRGGSHYFLFYKILLKYIVDLQCCVNFCCTEGLTLLTILKFRLLSPYHQTIEEISTHILFFSF